jgi:hypothetical protein
MESVADFKEKYQPQSWERLKASIRTRISIWAGLAAFVGWVLSRIPSKKRRTYVPGSIQEANHRSGEIKLAGKSKQLKDSGGLLSLVLELLGAIAIRLLQRYLKLWRSTLIVKLQNPLESANLSRKAVPKERNTLLDHRSDISPQNGEPEKPYQKGVVALFKIPRASGSKTNVPS